MQPLNALNYLGDLYLQLNKPQLARPYLDRALALYEADSGVEQPHAAHLLLSFAEYFRAIGDGETAVSFCQRALTILENIVYPQHPDLIRARALLNMLTP